MTVCDCLGGCYDSLIFSPHTFVCDHLVPCAVGVPFSQHVPCFHSELSGAAG